MAAKRFIYGTRGASSVNGLCMINLHGSGLLHGAVALGRLCQSAPGGRATPAAPSLPPTVMKRDTSNSVFVLIIHVASLADVKIRLFCCFAACTAYPSFSRGKTESRDRDAKKTQRVSKPCEHAIFHYLSFRRFHSAIHNLG